MLNNKTIIRKEFLELLRNQNQKDRLNKSRVIQKKLFETPEFCAAQTVMFYSSFDGEVETFEMMTQAAQLKKKVVLPIVMRDQKKLIPTVIEDLAKLKTGSYGIQEPEHDARALLDVEDLDLVIVPGVAFDKNNRRLGRGAGYYDRFLKDLPSDTPTFGLAFDFQVVDCLPYSQAHDIPVKRVITN